jgi:hypothetical protein
MSPAATSSYPTLPPHLALSLDARAPALGFHTSRLNTSGASRGDRERFLSTCRRRTRAAARASGPSDRARPLAPTSPMPLPHWRASPLSTHRSSGAVQTADPPATPLRLHAPREPPEIRHALLRQRSHARHPATPALAPDRPLEGLPQAPTRAATAIRAVRAHRTADPAGCPDSGQCVSPKNRARTCHFRSGNLPFAQCNTLTHYRTGLTCNA